MWRTTFDINVTGGYLVADECRQVWEAQGLPGSLVLTTSVNAVVAKKGRLAYDASQGRGQPPGARAGRRTGAAGARERVAPATVVQGIDDVPAATG